MLMLHMVSSKNSSLLTGSRSAGRGLRGCCVMKKLFSKELIVLWVSLAALIFAALSLNSSLNQFADMD